MQAGSSDTRGGGYDSSDMARTPSRRLKRRPREAEFFEFAEKVALIFDRPEAAHLRARLFEEATTYRNRYRPHGPADLWATTTKWTAFLLRLILTCPRILARPPDFEWVMDDLEWILIRRRVDLKYDRDFWDAVDRIRGPIRTGRPHDKALDYFRYETVQNLMNPPAQLKDLVKRSEKEEAVMRTADMEERLFEKRPDRRVIYRSLERVERKLRELNALLKPQSSYGSQPTTQLGTEPKQAPKKIAGRRRQSARPKSMRRK